MKNNTSRYTVLIERRRAPHWLLALLMLTLAFALLGGQHVFAAPGDGNGPGQKHRKMARDLDDVETAAPQQGRRWMRERGGRRMVQVVIVSADADRNMTALKAEVARVGGSVDAAMPGLSMLTASLPVRQVARIGNRADVRYVAPNRETRRTASTLEAITGATTSAVRANSTKTSYSGLDGTGVGIAVVDSGVMRMHEAFNNAAGVSRVARNVQFMTTSLADWTNGYDASTSLQPGSAALAAYEAAINNSASLVQDAYGHGTHVASIAAGRPVTYGVAPDLTGLAPNASIYDVKVLNDQGVGTLSDTLEGIQWVIYHAKEYNIRVMNLSLAMASTDSWQDDPLCVAARSAVSVGITVVVAAGNFGKNAQGREVYGSISSPGNDPSVITVGSSNSRGTVGRADDLVNMFSSRGPTRGGRMGSNGVRVPDNVLKPDLVAPGNQVTGAAATRADAVNPAWNGIAAANYAQLVTATGIAQTYRETQMYLSGTSVAAPVVAGAAALLLQANPGLTPPMVKAILQYTAQPIAGANLLQQGAGLLNVHGAVTLAKSLRTDIALRAGQRHAGPRGVDHDRRVPDPLIDRGRQHLQLVARRVRRRQPRRLGRRAVHPAFSRSTTRATPGRATWCWSATPTTGTRRAPSSTGSGKARRATSRCSLRGCWTARPCWASVRPPAEPACSRPPRR
jgi:subtilisin family serine protease